MLIFTIRAGSTVLCVYYQSDVFQFGRYLYMSRSAFWYLNYWSVGSANSKYLICLVVYVMTEMNRN